MPLGKTPILQNDLMAEGDNNKFILFNNSLVRLEDAENRRLVVDLAAASVVVTESQALRNGFFDCTGHTAPRSLTFPETVGTSDPLSRKVAVRNSGTASVTVICDGGGETVVIPADETALLYLDGVDVISLGGIANSATLSVQDDGVEVASVLEALNFTGAGYTVTVLGGTVTVDLEIPVGITDFPEFPAFTGHAGKFAKVNGTADGFEYETIVVETGASIKTKYEAEANTNAFTDAEQTKLAGIETGATADMTGAEIKVAYEGEANTNAFTDAEKTKLAGLADTLFKGIFVSDGALTTAHPAPDDGSYAFVDAGIGTDSELYIWDSDDGAWIVGGSSGGSSETPTTIKTKYESNADTNAFTDAEQTKLAGIESGATADMSASEIKTAYESNADTNAFTDAQETKLAGIETGATTDMTGAEIVAAIDTQLGSSTWQSGGGGGGSSEITIVTHTSSQTAVLTEGGKYIRMNSASAITYTVPTNATVAFPLGTIIHLRQLGVGQLTIVASGGVTITTPETLKTRKQHSNISLLKVGTDAWELTGDMEAA